MSCDCNCNNSAPSGKCGGALIVICVVGLFISIFNEDLAFWFMLIGAYIAWIAS